MEEVDLGSRREACDRPDGWRIETLSFGVSSGVATWGRIDQGKKHLYLAKKVVGVVLVECMPVLKVEKAPNLVFFEEEAVFVPEAYRCTESGERHQ